MNLFMYFLVPVSFLSGCAANVKSLPCSGVDWRAYGYKAGQSGKSVRDFDKYRDGCADGLEKNALTLYVEGYGTGIAEFCTYENGYTRGFSNRTIEDVCPLEMRSAYEKGYKLGQFELREKINKLKQLNDDQGMRDTNDRGDSGMTPE